MDSPTPAVTLQDVADAAGVSRATASLSLRGKGRFSAETRQRIEDAARDLGYVVNVTARNLRTARSGAVGLYVPDHTLSFRYYMDVAFGAVERAAESDLLVTLMPTAFRGRSAITEQLDGFIVVDPVDGDPVVERLLTGRRPVVSGEHVPAGLPAPWATAYGDHVAGMRMLLDHLWERGARRPACMLPDPSMAWGREMAEGYAAWCAEKGVSEQRVLGWFDTTMDRVRSSFQELLARDDRPDSIVSAPEGMALIAVEAIRAAGLVVGRDVLVASYVDSDALAVTDPPVTSLDLGARQMGRQTMDLLADALEGRVERRGSAVEVPISLVVRASTAGIRTETEE
ncbi:LacI family transcriptional regulator [Agromyces tardus]|uniref:LacI family transcriptional regulator n=1 Tax=Agromyces tardus TaxID=2583849 RepID=A0A3M8ACZ2_9MICO|nr:LacI family DNA-binding transcriptional regulator [Agromyces tardus]RNB48385.1 LacI family transcriptional regulator [Agromyces tardus]